MDPTLIAVIVGFLFICIVIFLSKPADADSTTTPNRKKSRDFYIYNYFKVPISVKVVTAGSSIEGPLVDYVKPGQREGVSIDLINKYLRGGATVRVYKSTSAGGSMIVGENTLHIPDATTIKALHCGMNSAQYNMLRATSHPVQGYGMGVSTIRLVNLTPRVLRLQIGQSQVTIQPFESTMYSGHGGEGVPLGTVFEDADGIIQPYKLKVPVTDIHFGIVSDTQIPEYDGSKYTSELDDTQHHINPEFASALGYIGGPHRGASIDRTIIA